MVDAMDQAGTSFAPLDAGPRPIGRIPDRISVRDDVRAVEIGAFGVERGAEQRLRFNVVLEVAPHGGARVDDVDRVLSYDTITDAITDELARERLNLLETLAERIAERCLADQRALRAFVRIEKLDRSSGALGVEIVRERDAEAAEPDAPGSADALVLYLDPATLAGPEGPAWLAAAQGRPAVVLCLAPDRPEPPAASEPALRVGLLSIERAAWSLAASGGAFDVVGSRTELDWALGQGRPAVWAPVKMVLDARVRPEADASAPEHLAAWLARELGARLAVGPGSPAPEGALRLAEPAALLSLSKP